MAGYDWTAGMSNNAVEAYQSGELPASKVAKKYGLKSAKMVDMFFPHSSWHHTSKFYNRTYFYNIGESIDDLDWLGCVDLYKRMKAAKALTVKGKKIFCELFRDKLTDGLHPYFSLTEQQINQSKNKAKRRKYLAGKYGEIKGMSDDLLDEGKYQEAKLKELAEDEIKRKISDSLSFYENDSKKGGGKMLVRRENFLTNIGHVTMLKGMKYAWRDVNKRQKAFASDKYVDICETWKQK